MVTTGTENLVVRAGWFGTRVYQGTPEFESGESFVRLHVGSFRPKYAIVAEAAKETKTEGAVTAVDIKKAYVDLSRITGTDAAGKPVYGDYVRLFIDGVTAADPDVKYTVLLME